MGIIICTTIPVFDFVMACWRLEGKHRPEENAKNYIILICRGGTSSVLHDSAHPSFLVNTAGISASGSLPEEVYK
jgi:hypothetical protein